MTFLSSAFLSTVEPIPFTEKSDFLPIGNDPMKVRSTTRKEKQLQRAREEEEMKADAALDRELLRLENEMKERAREEEEKVDQEQLHEIVNERHARKNEGIDCVGCGRGRCSRW